MELTLHERTRGKVVKELLLVKMKQTQTLLSSVLHASLSPFPSLDVSRKK